jgi:hypothetical protein
MTHDIRDVPGFDDRRQAEFGGGLLEMRYRVLDRDKAPFGLTFSFEPGAKRIDELTSARVEQYGSEFSILMDKEIIRNRLSRPLIFPSIWQPRACTKLANGPMIRPLESILRYPISSCLDS